MCGLGVCTGLGGIFLMYFCRVCGFVGGIVGLYGAATMFDVFGAAGSW